MQAQDVVADLLDSGLLEARDVVDGGLTVVDSSRRNANFHVLAQDRPGIVVKVDARRGCVPGTVQYEAIVHRLLAEVPQFGSLADRLPEVVGYDLPTGSLRLGFVADSENLRQRHQRLGRTPEHVAALLGATLGDLHAAGARAFQAGRLAGVSAELPDALGLTLPRLELLHGTSAGMRALISALQNLPDVADPMAALVADWRPQTVIHGDPRWDNWLVRGDEGHEAVVLVDWEFARVGDPAWDVGAVLGDYVAAWILGAPELPDAPLAAGVSLSAFPLAALQPAMAALWAAYVDRRAPADPDDELERVVRCTAAKLVEVGGEQMFRAADLSASTGALIQLAANMFALPGRAAAEVLGIAVTSPREP